MILQNLICIILIWHFYYLICVILRINQKKNITFKINIYCYTGEFIIYKPINLSFSSYNFKNKFNWFFKLKNT